MINETFRRGYCQNLSKKFLVDSIIKKKIRKKLIKMLSLLKYYTPLELVLMIGTLAVIVYLISELFDINLLDKCDRLIASGFSNKTCNNFMYGYNDDNGPITWKFRYPDANGLMQSPINILSKEGIVSTSCDSLKWSMYSTLPSQIILWNDGHSVILQPNFSCPRPHLSGGPLKQKYELLALRFRWGANDYEGSEHTIDYIRYALEIQAFHRRENLENECENLANDQTLILSYIFQVTEIENPYLEDIVYALRNIRKSGSKIFLQPFPLSWLLPQFSSDFYMYSGSLTNPPCTEGVKWIIQPEPLAISSQQVRQFRRILNDRGQPLQSNCRPIQSLNGRDVFYYSD